jgi:hypothetical protein
MSKRGLSNVIATVLIVLLVLAAVAIFWGFIGPFIGSTGEKIVASGKCLPSETEIVPIRCVSDGAILTTLIVEQSKGKTDFMKYVIRDANGNSFVSDSIDSPKNTLETKTISNVSLSSVTTAPFKVSVVAVFIAEDGEETLCPESTQITCTAPSP